MSPKLFSIVIIAYFALLIFISYISSRKSDSESFFTGNRKSPWYLVAFGMIGASLSGVTFISVPGEVGNSNFYYFQMVLGYLVGYFTIAYVLLPVYYKMNLISIYGYLEKRFGRHAYKTGSAFFLLSRVIGASFRLFLVAKVMQIGIFDHIGVPFEITIAVTLAMIWLYTRKAGIKTIVWTDTLQTFFMIAAVITSVIIIAQHLDIKFADIIHTISSSDKAEVLNLNPKSGSFVLKHFIAGAFIAVVMTGLDQDMMQKNLTCKTLKDAQKNMIWMSIALVPVNLLFLSVGVLLYQYAQPLFDVFTQVSAHNPNQTISILSDNQDVLQQFSQLAGKTRTDELFPTLALYNFGTLAAIIFVLGITAAAFSSADSALTALTTAFLVDFLDTDISQNDKKLKRKKQITHIGFSILLFLVIVIFEALNDDSVVTAIFKVAAYTYGPLLGMFSFGLITKRRAKDKIIPYIALAAPILSFILNRYSETLLGGYKFGFELLIVNGFLTFLGLLLFSKKSN